MSNSDDPPKPLRTLIGRPVPKLDPPDVPDQPAEKPATPAPLPGLTPSVVLPPGGDSTIPMGSSSLRDALNAVLANPSAAAASMDAVRAAAPRAEQDPSSTAPMGSTAIKHAASNPVAGKGPLAATTKGSPPTAQQLAEAIAKAANDSADRNAAERNASIGRAAIAAGLAGAPDPRARPPTGPNPAQPAYGSNPAQNAPSLPADSMFARQKSPTAPNAYTPGAGSNLVIPQGYPADPNRAHPGPNPAVDPTAMAMNAPPGYADQTRARPPTNNPAVDPNAFAAKPGSNPSAAAYDPHRVDPNAFAAKPGSSPGSAAYYPPSSDPSRVHDPTMFTAPGAQYSAPAYPAIPMAPHDATMMASPASQVPLMGERPRISTNPIHAVSNETLREVPIENYQISDEIARGGMGRILRAKDLRLHREVAIKELLGNNAHFKARFERETLITARLQHPAIVPIYDAGRWPTGELFYTMKLVAGKPLETLIDNVASMRERIALLPNMIAVAEALAYAHSHNVVHRDLKPANILIGDFGETIVIDWGLAKDLTTNEAAEPAGPFRSPAIGSVGATVAGSIMGTPAYMPFEQGRGLQVDARADVYAIGAVLYHVLGKRAPYDGPDGMSVLQALLKEPPPPLTAIAPDVPPELAAIVAKAMAREPEHRYPTARELVDDLRRYQNGQMVGVHRYTARELFRRWAKRHKGALAVGVLSFVALLVIGIIAISRVVAANKDAQRDRDIALEQSKAAQDARTRAESSESRAKKSEQLVAVERDRQKFVRERRVEFDHFEHTKLRKCAECHVIDTKTFTAKAGHPGHDECQGCHDAKSMAGLSNDPKCAFCHIDRVAMTKDHVSLRACDSGVVTSLRGAGGKVAHCFPHDLKAHRFDEANKPLDCTTCHAVIADKAKWGVKKYASLQDLDTNTIIGQGPAGGIDAMHKACTTGCHAHEGQTGQGAGQTKCTMCHPARDMSEF